MTNEAADRVVVAMIGDRDVATEWPDVIGNLVKLTREERLRLKLWPIYNHDQSLDEIWQERDDRRRARKRQVMEARRRAKGQQTRAAYLAQFEYSENKRKPWIAQGISKATYYRRKSTARETGFVTRK